MSGTFIRRADGAYVFRDELGNSISSINIRLFSVYLSGGGRLGTYENISDAMSALHKRRNSGIDREYEEAAAKRAQVAESKT